MTMKKICIFLALVTALTSCVKDVVLDAKEDSLLAVYCVLKVDSVQELKLFYTKSATMDEAPRVTEATAVLTDLTEGREAGRFAQVSDSLWRLDYSAIPTHTYRLEVTTLGSEPVWAEQTMPAEPQVEAVDVNSLTAQDVPWLGTLGEEDLIPWAGYTYYEGRPPSKTGFFYRFSSPGPIWVYANLFVSDQFVSYCDLCTDSHYVDDINLTGKVWKGVKFDDKEPFDANMIGFHITYLSDVPLYRNFLRFPMKNVWSQSFFTVDYFISTEGGEEGVLHLYFAALSDDYDRYLLDAYRQYYAEQSDDLSSIYLRENLYGNVHGGVGIFGAAVEVEVPYRRVSASGVVTREDNHL